MRKCFEKLKASNFYLFFFSIMIYDSRMLTIVPKLDAFSWVITLFCCYFQIANILGP